VPRLVCGSALRRPALDAGARHRVVLVAVRAGVGRLLTHRGARGAGSIGIAAVRQGHALVGQAGAELAPDADLAVPIAWVLVAARGGGLAGVPLGIVRGAGPGQAQADQQDPAQARTPEPQVPAAVTDTCYPVRVMGRREEGAGAAAANIVAGKYELIELAGEGGMATVWRGLLHGAAGFSRPIAIKRLKPEFRAIKNYVDMFVEEARVGAELNHPNIVQVVDFCADGEGLYYLIMEWVDGLDLLRFARLVAETGRPLEWPLAAAIGVGVLRGLAAAHERCRPDGARAPVVHRDVSPHNILIGHSGVVKLSDFGLARARDRLMSHTSPGALKGKLHYFAPEVTRGLPATPRSDVFSLSVVLWEVLAGRRAFGGANERDVLGRIRRGEVDPLARIRPDLPPRLVAAVDRGMATAVERRFVSARQMAVELGECLREAGEYVDQQAALARRIAEVQERARALGHALSAAELEQPTWTFTVAPSARGEK
jgi:eukaryotic-like serine/threonine-protein kinase